MILFQDHLGLCCYPAELIASITPAFPSRLRVETADGTVGYCSDVVERAQSGFCAYSAGKRFEARSVRRVDFERGLPLLTLDSGEQVKATAKFAPGVRSFLGLDSYVAQPESLTRVFLREYPFEIARASAQVLRQSFSSARHLIANLIWQALEYYRQGLEMGYGKSHRGFLYKPVKATVERADLNSDEVDRVYERQLAQMIDQDALFGYRDLAFQDSHSHLREIGVRHPEIILVIEKECVSEAGIAAARELGLSWIVTGGVARLLAVEFFCEALHKVYRGPVTVIDLGDFDPGGWVSGRTFVDHLARYHTPCPLGAQFLVRPELFTAEELELYSRALSIKNERIDGWLEESGGIAGQARGIHCDWLYPPERVVRAIQNLLAAL